MYKAVTNLNGKKVVIKVYSFSNAVRQGWLTFPLNSFLFGQTCVFIELKTRKLWKKFNFSNAF